MRKRKLAKREETHKRKWYESMAAPVVVHIEPKSKIGRWMENQRRAYKLYDMPAERAELMQQMGLFPERPEDMVDGRSSPRKKRKSSYLQQEAEEVSPSRKKRTSGSESEHGTVNMSVENEVNEDLSGLV